MRITASRVTLSAETSVVHATSESVQGRVWVGERPTGENVQVSAAARATALAFSAETTTIATASALVLANAAERSQSANNASGIVDGGRESTRPAALDAANHSGATAGETGTTGSAAMDDDSQLLGSAEGAKLLVLRRLLEVMTGRKIRLAVPTETGSATADPQATAATAPLAADESTTPNPASSPERAGWGVELDVVRKSVATTSVDFTAQGTIVTEDGKSISFDASFVKRSSSEVVQQFSLRAGDAQLKDPLVLLYSGTHAELTEQAQAFDLDADGTLERLPGIANGAYVAQDLNGNGRIDDGRELIGALSGDGFSELQAMDDDGNGFVDSGDRQFGTLYLWKPGPSGGKITSLADAGLLGLHTGSVATPFELQAPGGELAGRVRTTGIYVTDSGTVRPLEQIDVKV